MMLSFAKFWRGVLILGALFLLALVARPAKAEGMDKPAARGSDSRQFLEELRSGGALKFYEDTEDILRAGKFERAYIRYIFLNAHIRGQPLDNGLVPMVEQRLQFLRGQMRLGEGIQYAERDDRLIRRRRPAKPACPPPPKEAKKPDSEEEPHEIVIPPAPPEDKTTPPKEEAKPPGEEAPKPAPAPSAWDKLKRRLKFW
jgi:hypothetical protein